jgi:hypothetical protein
LSTPPDTIVFFLGFGGFGFGGGGGALSTSTGRGITRTLRVPLVDALGRLVVFIVLTRSKLEVRLPVLT